MVISLYQIGRILRVPGYPEKEFFILLIGSYLSTGLVLTSVAMADDFGWILYFNMGVVAQLSSTISKKSNFTGPTPIPQTATLPLMPYYPLSYSPYYFPGNSHGNHPGNHPNEQFNPGHPPIQNPPDQQRPYHAHPQN